MRDKRLSPVCRIEKLGGQGMGIARVDGKVALVPFAVPGDEVVLALTRDKKSFWEAKIHELRLPSPLRAEPRCPHFGSCGGCAHQNILYEEQCRLKGELLKETFRHFYPGVEEWEEVTPSPLIYHYRNKVHWQVHVSSREKSLLAGFYRFRSRRLVAIDNCPLCAEPVNMLLAALREVLSRKGSFPVEWVRDIVIHANSQSGQLMLTLITRRRELPGERIFCSEMQQRVPGLIGVYSFYNPHPSELAFKYPSPGRKQDPLRRLTGGYLREVLGGVEFRLAPPAFFQVNKEQTEQILRRIRLHLEREPDVRTGLLDLYAGMGTLSLPLAELFGSVLCVEVSPAAVEQGEENTRRNNLSNCRFLQQDALAFLLEGFSGAGGKEKLGGRYPCLFVDPPRGGLAEELCALLGEGIFRMIFYLSCAPQTQARDLGRILAGGKYRVAGVYPFDMFPHTFHLENLIVLKRSEG